MDAIMTDTVSTFIISISLFMFGVMWGIGGLYCEKGSFLRKFCLAFFIADGLASFAAAVDVIFFNLPLSG